MQPTDQRLHTHAVSFIYLQQRARKRQVALSAIYHRLWYHLKLCDRQIVFVTFLPAITVSISYDIRHQLLFPIYNRSALQIVFEKRIAVGRVSCHSSRIESL